MSYPEPPSIINKKGKLVAPKHSLNATKPFPESKIIIKPKSHDNLSNWTDDIKNDIERIIKKKVFSLTKLYHHSKNEVTAYTLISDENNEKISAISWGIKDKTGNINIDITANYRRMHIGKIIVVGLERLFKLNGVEQVRLDWVAPHAMPFWSKMGYKKLEIKEVDNSDPETWIKNIFNYESETSLIACEKYPIAKLKKIGAGSDRIVYDIEDRNVLKIAKNPRGLLQNTFEVPDYVLKDLVPEVRETGLDYVIVEKLTINRKLANKFLKPLKPFTPIDFDNKTGELQEAFEKMGIDVLLNYDVLFNDIKAPRNWGFRNDKPVLIDTGSLSREILDKETIAYYKSDWQIILSKRRACQKKQ